MGKNFLTAQWNNLIMANFVIDPQILLPCVPAKTELDFYHGECYVSLIGFMFEQTAILGIRIPFHINFEEVNLRFYVRYNDTGVWKRGAVFIKEIVPKAAITFIANTFYREKYVTLPMKHYYREKHNRIELGYQWKCKNEWQGLQAVTEINNSSITAGSKEEFITEHYWGYSKYNETDTVEYGVQHPRWKIHKVKAYKITCDFENLYGKGFAFMNSCEPDSVFMAAGSPIKILHKKKI